MDEYYIPGFTNDLTSGVQRLPTEQPVQAVTEYAPLDLGDWNIGMVNTRDLNLLSDPGAAYDPNMVYRFDTGAKIGVPDEQGGFTYRNAAPVVFQPGQTYALTDYKNNVIGSAATPEEMQSLISAADKQAPGGWKLYQGDVTPGAQLFGRSPKDDTLKNVLIAGATAMGGGLLGPYIQGAGTVAPGAVGAAATPLGAGLAAGGVNAAANLATGASLADALKSGAMAGLSSAAMTGLLGGGKTPNVGDLEARAIDTADLLSGLGVNPTLANQIASGSLSNVGGAAGGFGGAAGAPTAGGNLIQVIGSKGVSNIPTSFLSGALGAASGALSGVNYGDQIYNQGPSLEEQFDETFGAPTTVYGAPISNPASAAGGLAGGIAGTVPGAGTYYPNENLVEVSSGKNKPVNAGISVPVVPTAPAPATTNPNEIVVSNKYKPPSFNETLASVVGGVAPTLVNTGVTQPTTTDTKKGLTTSDYLRLAGLAASTLGGLGGKGSSSGLSGLAGMRGPLNPIFSAQLPTSNLQQAAPRSMAGTDWYRYGYGPEQSFFSNVPQGAANLSNAYTGYGEGAGRTTGALQNVTAPAASTPVASTPTVSGAGMSGLGAAASLGTSNAPASTAADISPSSGFSAAELEAFDKQAANAWARRQAEIAAMTQAGTLPEAQAIDPALLAELQNRVGALDAMNQKYMTEYGVPADMLRRVAAGSYLANTRNPEPFSEFKPYMDQYRTEYANMFGANATPSFITGDPQYAGRDLQAKLDYLEYLRGHIAETTNPEVRNTLLADYNSRLADLQRVVDASPKYAEGGMAGGGLGQSTQGYAVGGPGDGRDDKIPAMLSDGEYVIDAETVAMLGNGSSKAGAEALDQFRVNVRKHKGRHMAKGEFSANAKKPEQYLKGRK